MAQRRFGIALRTVWRCGRAHSRIYQLATAWAAACDWDEARAVIQNSDGDGFERFLQRRQRNQLRTVALPLLLHAGEGTAAEVLPGVSDAAERRSDWVSEFTENIGRAGYGCVQNQVGEVCIGVEAGISGSGNIRRLR